MKQPTSDTPSSSPALQRAAAAILWAVVLVFGLGLAYSLMVPGQRTARVSSIVFWYAAPALAVVLAVWALRSSAERRVVVALFLASTVGSVFAAEAILRAFPERVAGFPLTTTEAEAVCPGEWRNHAGCLAAAAAGRPFDHRTTLDMIRDFERRGVEAWPSVDASHYYDPDNVMIVEGRVVVPLSPGVPEVLTVFCNESGDWVTYVADEYGFNNPPSSHRAGEIDVAVVGDSYVHGWCVPFEQTLVGQMRLGDPGMPVLGVGLEGSGPLTQLGIEREYLKPLRPAVVAWLFFEGNDLRDLRRELSNELLRGYLDPHFDQGLRDLGQPLDRALRDQILQLRSKEEVRADSLRMQRESVRRRRASVGGWIRLTEIRSRLGDLRRFRTQAQPYDSATLTAIASRMRDDVASWGGTLLFAYLPSRHRFEDPPRGNPHRASIMEQVAALGIPTIDLLEPLSMHPDPLSLYPFRLENHLTPEGYDLLARALGENLRSLSSRAEGNRTGTVDTK